MRQLRTPGDSLTKASTSGTLVSAAAACILTSCGQVHTHQAKLKSVPLSVSLGDQTISLDVVPDDELFANSKRIVDEQTGRQVVPPTLLQELKQQFLASLRLTPGGFSEVISAAGLSSDLTWTELNVIPVEKAEVKIDANGRVLSKEQTDDLASRCQHEDVNSGRSGSSSFNSYNQNPTQVLADACLSFQVNYTKYNVMFVFKDSFGNEGAAVTSLGGSRDLSLSEMSWEERARARGLLGPVPRFAPTAWGKGLYQVAMPAFPSVPTPNFPPVDESPPLAQPSHPPEDVPQPVFPAEPSLPSLPEDNEDRDGMRPQGEENDTPSAAVEESRGPDTGENAGGDVGSGHGSPREERHEPSVREGAPSLGRRLPAVYRFPLTEALHVQELIRISSRAEINVGAIPFLQPPWLAKIVATFFKDINLGLRGGGTWERVSQITPRLYYQGRAQHGVTELMVDMAKDIVQNVCVQAAARRGLSSAHCSLRQTRIPDPLVELEGALKKYKVMPVTRCEATGLWHNLFPLYRLYMKADRETNLLQAGDKLNLYRKQGLGWRREPDSWVTVLGHAEEPQRCGKLEPNEVCLTVRFGALLFDQSCDGVTRGKLRLGLSRLAEQSIF